MSRERMDHREARGLLSDFVADGLDEAVASRVRDHLCGCRECRDWVATYGVLQQAFENVLAPDEEHPPSDLLALCVVRPEEVSELDRKGLRQHLDRCVACRSEIETLQAAVRQARPGNTGAVREQLPPAEKRRRLVAHPVLLAAGLGALAFGLGGLYVSFVAGPEVEHLAFRKPMASILSTETVRPEEGPERRLSDVDLEDSHLIEADHSLLVTNVKVKPGARVTFRAGETAAFGDGFQISDGGSIVVEVGRRRNPRRGRGDSS